MGNSQSIDLILDPANQSEITDVSVWLCLVVFFFFKEARRFCGLLSKDMDICFPNSRVFANQVSIASFSVAF